jgi:hypothetical protein
MKPKTYKRAGWIILFILGILMAINSLFFGLLGVTPEIFEFDTGVAWTNFASDYPAVAAHLDLETRLNGSGFFGVALFAAALAFFGVRRDERWAWKVLWIFPGILTLGSVWFFMHNRPGLGFFYIGAAGIAILGLLLSSRPTRLSG